LKAFESDIWDELRPVCLIVDMTLHEGLLRRDHMRSPSLILCEASKSHAQQAAQIGVAAMGAGAEA
jgi:hypothetical protein